MSAKYFHDGEASKMHFTQSQTWKISEGCLGRIVEIPLASEG
jgi:hypothetical protein